MNPRRPARPASRESDASTARILPAVARGTPLFIIWVIWVILVPSLPAQLPLNTGTTNNDGTGLSLRAAMLTIGTNTTTVFSNVAVLQTNLVATNITSAASNALVAVVTPGLTIQTLAFTNANALTNTVWQITNTTGTCYVQAFVNGRDIVDQRASFVRHASFGGPGFLNPSTGSTNLYTYRDLATYEAILDTDAESVIRLRVAGNGVYYRATLLIHRSP